MALEKIQRSPARRGAAQPPRSRAFFLELLLNMLIFALCAVVALQVFVEGKVVTDESAALTRLTLDAETLAEEFKASDGEVSSLELASLEGTSGEDGTLTYYYDANLEPTNEDAAAYQLHVAPVDTGSELISAIELTGYAADDPLFSYEVTHYQAREGR